jgi:two-component system sensor kinase FixL
VIVLSRIWQSLAPPIFEDEDKSHVAALLNTTLLATLAMTVIMIIGLLFTPADSVSGSAITGLLALLELGMLFLMHRGRVRLASWLLLCILGVFFILVTFAFGGVRSPSFSSYIVVILVAGLLLGGRAGLGFAGLGIVAGLGILWVEISGSLPPTPVPITPALEWVAATASFIMAAVLLQLATHSINNALERARRNERDLLAEVAERMRTEEALHTSEALFRAISEQMPDALFLLALDDPQVPAKIIYANEAAARTHGYTLEEMIGRSITFLDDPATAEKAPDHIKRLLTGETVLTEGAHQRKDGSVFPVEITSRKIEYGGRSVVLAIDRDITERIQAQEGLQTYAAQLERSNRELHDFLSIASHDLQEPLRKVQTFGNRLQARYSDALDQRGRDYLARMGDTAARMQALINALQTYLEITTRPYAFVPVDMSEVARQVVSDLKTHIELVSGRVEMNDLPTVEADPAQMRQLLQNLIYNALKFKREDVPPLVKIYAKVESAGTASNNGHCHILVEDNGIGFDEKYLDRIFQVFQRLHGRGEYEGTGIGLATCRKIVERHGGNITARSAPGQGATFIVTLPVKQTQGEKSL